MVPLLFLICDMKEQYIGIFGGSFNPPHRGHTDLALAILRDRPEIKEIWFMVAKQNPQKEPDPKVTFEDRYRMVTLACQGTGDSRLVPCDIEASLESPFTCDTLQYLRDMWPATDDRGMSQFALIIGSDCYYNLNTWKNYHEILRRHRVYVYDRPGSRLKNINIHPDYSDMIFISPGTDVLRDISSTAIRSGEIYDLQGSLDPKVYDYAYKHDLYDWLPF